MRQIQKTRDVLRAALCVVTTLLLTACGQKGDLYLPEASPLLNIIVF